MTEDDLPVASLIVSRHGRVESVNQQGCLLLQRDPAEMMRMPFSVYIAPGNLQLYLSHLWDTFKFLGHTKECELHLCLRDGTSLRAGLRSQAFLRQEESEETRCRTILWRLPEPRYDVVGARRLFQELPYGAVWLDVQGLIEEPNPALCSLLDYDPVSLIRCSMKRLFPEWSEEAALTASLQDRSFRIHGIRRDGVMVPVEATLVPFSERLGRRAGLCFVRSLVEQEGLERRSMRAAELERQAIGRELHDSLGQNLVGMAFLADELAADLGADFTFAPEKQPEWSQKAKRLSGLCRDTSKITRGLVRGLVPVALDEGGLAPTLRDLADWVGTTTKVSCLTSCREVELPNEVAEQFFRIAQESVTNALKHSGCDEIRISLEVPREGAVILSVRDNGAGITPEETQRFGTGIHSMKHRAKMIRSHLSVRSDDEGGTCVTLRWTSPGPVRGGPQGSHGDASEE